MAYTPVPDSFGNNFNSQESQEERQRPANHIENQPLHIQQNREHVLLSRPIGATTAVADNRQQPPSQAQATQLLLGRANGPLIAPHRPRNPTPPSGLRQVTANPRVVTPVIRPTRTPAAPLRPTITPSRDIATLSRPPDTPTPATVRPHPPRPALGSAHQQRINGQPVFYQPTHRLPGPPQPHPPQPVPPQPIPAPHIPLAQRRPVLNYFLVLFWPITVPLIYCYLILVRRRLFVLDIITQPTVPPWRRYRVQRVQFLNPRTNEISFGGVRVQYFATRAEVVTFVVGALGIPLMVLGAWVIVRFGLGRMYNLEELRGLGGRREWGADSERVVVVLWG
ncbi:hypothetical protein QBC43DRAFT_339487 [Cladorrhinum sp. PSN259]|nr:hypothetical protein QBC43DRAFT_339487 [Cladorrhinum sp. PSN259]